MPERQIAMASTWFYREGQHVTVHRGEIVDIPDAELERLENLGALVPQGGELDRPGKLLKLLDNASEEHIRNYVESGTTDEILEQVGDYPSALVEKILIAEQTGQERQRLIAGLEARLRGENEPAEPVSEPTEPVTGSTTADGAGQAGDEDLVDFVLTNTVEAVLERAGDDPELAAALREAEESRGEKARKGVIEGLTKIESGEG